MFKRIRASLRGRKLYSLVGLFVAYKLGGPDALQTIARAILEGGEHRSEIVELLFGAGGVMAFRAGRDNAVNGALGKFRRVVGDSVAAEMAVRFQELGADRPSPVSDDLADHELDQGDHE